MGRPKSLTGATATVKIDGVDVKDYGMVINQIGNPVASVRANEQSIPTRHGSIGDSLYYESKTINISGDILGSSASDLASNIDSLKNLCRLRPDGTEAEIEPQNKTGYVWKGRLVSFDVQHKASWFAGISASFTLTIFLKNPFLEATTATTLSGTVKMGKIITVNYGGTFPTPLNINIKPTMTENLLYLVSDTNVGWTVGNCNLSLNATQPMYGTNEIVLTRTAANPYYAERATDADGNSIISKINTAKNYCFSAYSGFGQKPIQVFVWIDSTLYSGNITTSGMLDRSFVKIPGSAFVGATAVTFRVGQSGSESVCRFTGCLIREISAAEYADAAYTPYPYCDSTTSPEVGLTSPKITVTGKNICPIGANDLDLNNWESASKLALVYDDEVGRNALLIGPDTLVSAPFRIDPGTWNLHFKVKTGKDSVGGGSFQWQLNVICERAGFNKWSRIDGALAYGAVGATTAWQTVNSSFTVNANVVYARLYIFSGTTFWKKISEMQIESGSSFTSFEKYRKNYAKMDESFFDNIDRIFIDSRNGSAVWYEETTKDASNAMGFFKGDFLMLYPGINSIIMDDQRLNTDTPEEDSSGAFEYELSYRTRYL